MKTLLKWASRTALVLACGLAATAYGAGRPNVLVVLADDQGWGDLSVNGNKNLKTPNIDTLARDGATFDRFFVCSVCAPTRAEFLTGRYHLRGGVRGVSTGQERLNPDDKTIADTFKAAGYATGAFGKWHNGSQWPYHPNARGFQEYYGFTSGHWSDYFDPLLEHNGQLVRGKGYIIDDLTEHAMQFIEQNKDRQFFCYVPYNSPHTPFQVPDEFWNKHKNNPIAMRARLAQKEVLDETRCVMAMSENIDWNVGRLLKKLEDLKLAENTIVIYFSDNGPNTERWNDDMKGKKGSTDEGGLRSAFFIRWPGHIKGGAKVREIAGAIDLLPTLASLAGVPLIGAKPLDGKDVSPLIYGSAQNWPDRTIFSHQAGKWSARTQQYRLDNAGGLFDMVADPGQYKDIAKQKPELTQKLAQSLAAWKQEVNPARPDERPFSVGYAEFPWTPLPARDGVPHGGVERSANAPNCSYFTHWTTKEDSITWDIETHTGGDYEVAIYYTCPGPDAGSTVEVSFNGAKAQGKVDPAWDPAFYPDRDRVKRKGESYMKDFQPLKFGTMRLEKGRGLLTLKALQIPGKMVMDVRGVTLTLVKGAQ